VRDVAAGDPCAQRIRLRDLRYIAKSARNNGEDTVETYFGWRDTRALTVAKGLSAAALSILTAWFVPFLKSEYKNTSLWLTVATPEVRNLKKVPVARGAAGTLSR